MGGSYRPLQPEVVRCRSCSGPVIWVTVQKTGKRMPLDAAPSAQGNVVLLDHRHAVVLTREEQAASSERRYISHFATCPQSTNWRRRQGMPEPTVYAGHPRLQVAAAPVCPIHQTPTVDADGRVNACGKGVCAVPEWDGKTT